MQKKVPLLYGISHPHQGHVYNSAKALYRANNYYLPCVALHWAQVITNTNYLILKQDYRVQMNCPGINQPLPFSLIMACYPTLTVFTHGRILTHPTRPRFLDCGRLTPGSLDHSMNQSEGWYCWCSSASSRGILCPSARGSARSILRSPRVPRCSPGGRWCPERYPRSSLWRSSTENCHRPF